MLAGKNLRKYERAINILSFALILTIMLSLSIALYLNYSFVRKDLLDRAASFGSAQCQNSITIMMSYDKLYRDGKLTLHEAQEEAKEVLLGPMGEDGTRNMEKSFVGASYEVYTYAIGRDGTIVMHPFFEGDSVYNLTLPDGRNAGELLMNESLFGKITEYPFSNPGTKVTGLAYDYRLYYEPWGWIVGYGNNANTIYRKPLKVLLYTYIAIFVILMLIGLLLTSMIKKYLNKSLNKETESGSYSIR